MTEWRRANPEKARAQYARANAKPRKAHQKYRWSVLVGQPRQRAARLAVAMAALPNELQEIAT